MIAQGSQQDEEEHLEILRQYDILDSPPEPAFDDLASLAANLCNTPISFITLVDKDRQWVKSQVGLHVCEVPREFSICAHPIPHSDLFMVPDTSQDGRFADHPWVTGDPQIRFYAGAPLKTPEGYVLGTLGVLDRVPRVLNARQQEGLTTLSRQVLTQLELRHHRKISRLKVEVRGGKNESDFMTNAFPMPVAYVDATLRYRFNNQAYGEFLGIPTGTLEGRCIKDVLGQAAYETVKPYIDKVFSGHQVTIEKEVPFSQGNTRYGEATLIPDFDGTHAIKGFMVVVNNLTDRMRGEERFRLVVESAPCGMVMSNQEGKIVLVNSQTERLFGYTREELINQPIEILVPVQHRRKHRGYQASFFADLQKRPMGTGLVLYGLRKNGTMFPVEIGLNPIETSDGAMVLSSILDATERKQAEVGLMERNQLLALDAEVGQIINKSQELGTLLQGFTEALVRHLKAAFARIWTLNATEQILELQASAGLYTHLNGPHGRVPVGQLKIGKIAAEKKPHLTNAVIGDPRVP
ncbi:MAG: PAS domain S-box protein, partial [Nitrospirota bacterium]|nr:PAS domain S-box protein [Nitrospirota bacterium]